MRVCKSCIWFGDCAKDFQAKGEDRACEYFTPSDLTPICLREYKETLAERVTEYRSIIEEMED